MGGGRARLLAGSRPSDLARDPHRRRRGRGDHRADLPGARSGAGRFDRRPLPARGARDLDRLGAVAGAGDRLGERRRVQLLPHSADRGSSRSPTARTGSRWLTFFIAAVVASWLAELARTRAAEAEESGREAQENLDRLLEANREREALEAEAIEARALRRSDELKTALLRSVSHDLRSPLTAILAAGEALGSPAVSDEDRSRAGRDDRDRGQPADPRGREPARPLQARGGGGRAAPRLDLDRGGRPDRGRAGRARARAPRSRSTPMRRWCARTARSLSARWST